MSPSLLSLILERIRNAGPLTVAQFVDEALYHEELGYYARAGQRSGRDGDFVTSVDIGPMFGELLAVQFAEMRQILSGQEGPAPRDSTSGFDLVEAAAGNGRLARDILDHVERNHPGFYRTVRLHLVERSLRARVEQAAALGPHARLLASSTGELPDATTGVIYANELLDALPPHLVVMRERGLREVYVDEDGHRLVTREGPLSTPRIAEYLASVDARLEPGWFAEVNLAAADWIRHAASRLVRGFLVLIDYGHDAATLFSASHATGTLTTYSRHAGERREDGPGWLTEPGERDITSHVDLTGVAMAGRNAGLQLLGVVDQTYFLLGLGLAERTFEGAGDSPGSVKRRLALKTLLLPGGMGSSHKVMIFAKAIERCPPLRGLPSGGRVT
jgi:SAM-dependent MidA family methyltransferase